MVEMCVLFDDEVIKCSVEGQDLNTGEKVMEGSGIAGGKQIHRAGVAVVATKLGCSKEDARKILYAGNRMGIKFLDVGSAEEALKLIDERDRNSLDSRLSARTVKLKESDGISNLLKVSTSKKIGLKKVKKKVSQ